jgi:hypothetical protein
MYATIRRYEGVDRDRIDELTRKVGETLVPQLSKLPGFKGYYLIEAAHGVMSSFGLFETSTQADESTRIAASWVHDQKLESTLPNAPEITSGMVIAHMNGVTVVQATDGTVLAAVERMSLENLTAALSTGTLAFRMQRLAELTRATVVVEARYAALYTLEHVSGSWLADQLARLEVRYPEIPVVFADSGHFAEEWTYRFLARALADAAIPSPNN